MFRVVQNYFKEYYAIDTLILIELIKDKNLPITETLMEFPHIHYGYIKVVYPEDNKPITQE